MNIGLKLKPKLRAPDIPRLARSVFVLSLGSISKGTHLGRYQPEPKLRRCAVGIVERLRGWLVLLVELRLCFSWDSDFREVSSWVNRSCQLEPKLKRKPCLTSCISSKLGFCLMCPVAEVSLVFWTGVFLSPGRRICVTGKETGPGPGGYG